MKKVLSLFLSIIMLLSITAGLDFSAYALANSGTCGTNVTYTYTNTNGIGVLTISGSGAMRNYSYNDDSPFFNVTRINYIIIKNGVTSIGKNAFYDCTGLTSVTIPDSVTSIGERAFNNCTSLTSVTIPDSVTSIGNWAFYKCTSLTSVTIPNSVTSIGNCSFARCSSLTKISVDSSNKNYVSVDGVLFNIDMNNLIQYPAGKNNTTYDIPNSVTSIGDYAFGYCTSLTSVTIPDSVTSINSDTFSSCTSLTSVTIPNSVTSIGNWAFYKCTSLTSVTIPNSVTIIDDWAFRGCTSLTSVTIGNSVTSIGNYAFYECTGLTSIDIPNSVTSIGEYAFGNCLTLNNVTIGNSVTTINANAFSNCSKQSTIYLCSKKIESTQNLVASLSSSSTLYTFPSTDAQIYCDIYGVNFVALDEPRCEEGIHIYSETVTKQPTCTSEGIKTFTCSICGYNYTEPVEKIDHTPEEAVKEKEKAATCTATGSYDSVVYCSECNAELSRTKKTVAKKPHTYKTYTTKATTSAVGKIVTKCSVCGAVKSTQTIARISSVKLSSISYTYDGKVKTPSVTVKDVNGKALVKNTDYTVSYASGRKNVGKYAVKVTFKGKYSGTKTLYFTIKPKATSISSISARSKGFNVKWYKRTTQTTGYQVQFSTSSKFTSPKTVTISKTGTTSKTVSKLKAKKRYYVRVRTYKTVNGTRYYSSWSKAKYVTTKS